MLYPSRTEAERQVAAEISAVKQYSVDSKSQAVFYSGDKLGGQYRNHERALDYAKRTGAVPIDKTEAGRKLNGVYERNSKRFANETKANQVSDNIGHIASKRYARQAKGDVKTFVCGAREKSVFRKTELPILLNNSKVRSINGIDRKTIAKAHAKSPTRAYRMVALGELRQDRRSARAEARKTGNKEPLKDVLRRQNSYEKQFSKKQSKTPLTNKVEKRTNQLSAQTQKSASREAKQKSSGSNSNAQSRSASKTQSKKASTQRRPPPPPPPPPKPQRSRGR